MPKPTQGQGERLKVWGGILRGRNRYVVAASSQKEAAEIAGVSISYLRGWCSITGNADEVASALASPRTLVRSNYV